MSTPSPIRNYAIVECEDPKELCRCVAKSVEDGFQPLGGVAVVREPANLSAVRQVGRTLYVQAVIRLWQPGERITINGAGISV